MLLGHSKFTVLGPEELKALSNAIKLAFNVKRMALAKKGGYRSNAVQGYKRYKRNSYRGTIKAVVVNLSWPSLGLLSYSEALQ